MTNLFHLIFVEYIIYKISKPCIIYGMQKYKEFKQIKLTQKTELLEQKMKNQNKRLYFLKELKLGISLYKIIQKTFIILICIQIYDRIINKKFYNEL